MRSRLSWDPPALAGAAQMPCQQAPPDPHDGAGAIHAKTTSITQTMPDRGGAPKQCRQSARISDRHRPPIRASARCVDLTRPPWRSNGQGGLPVRLVTAPSLEITDRTPLPAPSERRQKSFSAALSETGQMVPLGERQYACDQAVLVVRVRQRRCTHIGCKAFATT